MKLRILGIALIAVMILSSPFTTAQAAVEVTTTKSVSFTDIEGHWSQAAVELLLEKDAIPFTESKFMPKKAVARSEFAVMLHNALGIRIMYLIEPKAADYYDDIAQSASYTSEVIDLVTAGVFEKGGNFNPDETLTREEMVHYIMQAYRYILGEDYAMIKIGAANFRDVDKITAEYSGDVARAEFERLIAGTGNQFFKPLKAATRGDVVLVLSRTIKRIDNLKQQIKVVAEAALQDTSMDLTITIMNNTLKDSTIEYTSGQVFDYELQDENGDSLYRWSADKSFISMMSTTTIKAGESIQYTDTLSGDTYASIKDQIVYLRVFITGTADFIHADGYEIKLK